MTAVSIFGWIAMVCTTSAFIPQVIKIIKTKNVEDISLATFSLQSFGCLMWLVYGALGNDMQLLVANAITLMLAAIILIFKILDVIKKRKNKIIT